MKKSVYLIAVAAFLLVLSACGGSQGEEPADSQPSSAEVEAQPEKAMENTSQEMSDESGEEMASEPMGSEEKPAMEESMSEDGDAGSTGEGSMTEGEHPADEAMETESMEEPASEEMAEETMDEAPSVQLPVWQTLPIVDARTGEMFTLSDFSGKTVFVEPMATWCGNCRRQLNNVREARQQLASGDVVFVGLSVETNISSAELADYAEREGFDWPFAVLSAELLYELSDQFGRSITNPPSTPHFIIRPDGTFTELVTGIEPAADLVAQISAIQG